MELPPATWPQGAQTSTRQLTAMRPGQTYKASHELGLEIPEQHFGHIVLAKEVTKTSPDSRGVGLDPTSQREK